MFYHIGFNNMISLDRVIAIIDTSEKMSAPIARQISAAKDEGRAIDATFGRRTGIVFFMDNGSIVLGSKTGKTVRFNLTEGEK